MVTIIDEETQGNCKQDLIIFTNKLVEDLENDIYYPRGSRLFEYSFLTGYLSRISDEMLGSSFLYALFTGLASTVIYNLPFTKVNSIVCRLASGMFMCRDGTMPHDNSDLERIISMRECISLPINDDFEAAVTSLKTTIDKLQESRLISTQNKCNDITNNIKNYLTETNIFTREVNFTLSIIPMLTRYAPVLLGGYCTASIPINDKFCNRNDSVYKKATSLVAYFIINILSRTLYSHISSFMQIDTTKDILNLDKYIGNFLIYDSIQANKECPNTFITSKNTL